MTKISWNVLDSMAALQELVHKSHETPVLIYKHSTRCSISSMVLSRLERSWDQSTTPSLEWYILDLITYREVSNAIAQQFQVYHESPQVLLIVDGNSSFDTSHMGISVTAIKEAWDSVSA